MQEGVRPPPPVKTPEMDRGRFRNRCARAVAMGENRHVGRKNGGNRFLGIDLKRAAGGEVALHGCSLFKLIQ